MSRFTVFEYDSDNESIVTEVTELQNIVETSDVVDSVDVVKKSETDNVKSKLKLTSTNLLKLGDVSTKSIINGKLDIDHLITNAKKILHDLMKGHTRNPNIREINVMYYVDFLKYMTEKSRNYFTCLHDESISSYTSERAIIYSWKYGKNHDGSPIYLYISFIEGYGTCSLCDFIMNLNEKINSYLYELESYERILDLLKGIKKDYRYSNEEIERSSWENKIERNSKIDEFKERIWIIKDEIRNIVNEHISDVASRLVISRSYSEAVKHITRYDNFRPPSLKKALKNAFPDKDFSHMDFPKNKRLHRSKVNDYIVDLSS